MDSQASNAVARQFVATSGHELNSVLENLPYGVRYGVVRDLEETGEAHRFERLRHCAYYLARLEEAIEIWRWNYIASSSEAARLRILIEARHGRLDERAAAVLFEQATHRTVAKPRLPGMAYFAAPPRDIERPSGVGSNRSPPAAPGGVRSPLPC